MTIPKPNEDAFAKISDPDFPQKIDLVGILLYPQPKRIPNHFEKIEDDLFEIWRNICSKYMIDDEYRYIYFDYEHSYENQEPWEDENSEVLRALENSRLWVADARSEIGTLFKPLYSIVANAEKYPKHYSYLKETLNEMRARSITKDAILHPDLNDLVQDAIFVKVLEQFFPVILKNTDTCFIIECQKLTGFSEGQDCTKLLCKINNTSCIVHFYPIHDHEVWKYEKDYENPVLSDPDFKLFEADENKHLFQPDIKNLMQLQ